MGSRAWAQLWHTGLASLRHVGSSHRSQIHIPCIGRKILIHGATREVSKWTFLKYNYSESLLTSSSLIYIYLKVSSYQIIFLATDTLSGCCLVTVLCLPLLRPYEL